MKRMERLGDNLLLRLLNTDGCSFTERPLVAYLRKTTLNVKKCMEVAELASDEQS